MNKFIFALFALAVAVGFMMPAGKPAAPAASAAKVQKEGLFEAPPYKETELRRRPDGHFYVDADVNDASITFLVDTGATVIALTEEDARAAGLQFSRAEFGPVARTASGIARGKTVTLPNVTIEGKEVTGAEAMIVEGAEISLLGQSYLARITGVQMNGDRMILR